MSERVETAIAGWWYVYRQSYQFPQQPVQTFSVQDVRLFQRGVQVDAAPTAVGAGRFNTVRWLRLIPWAEKI